MTPNPYDQASRYTAKLDPPDFLCWLLPGPAAPAMFRGWLDTRTLPFPGEPDRICDTVAGLVEETDPNAWWALPIEFQRRPSALMFGRLLEYLARLWLELRPPGLPEGRYALVAAVVNLTGVGNTSRDMALGQTGLRTCLRVAERNLAEEDAAATLADMARGNRGRWLLPWIPLMRGGAEASIIEQWKELAQAEPDNRRRADYGGLALVFSELTDCRPLWKQALEGWNVEQSLQVLEWQAEARKAGKAEGEAEALLKLLAARFPPAVPPALETRIRSMTDLAQLDRWITAAATAATLDEFHHLVSS
jgi:hypothetical protein